MLLIIHKYLSLVDSSEETVVHGAAIQAISLQKLRDGDRTDVVTQLSLGVGCGEKSEDMSIIIKRNTVLPARCSKFFYTRYDYQTSILFEVFQGESRRSKNNILLGKLLITSVPASLACLQKVLITMDVTKSGILTAAALLVSTGATCSLKLNTLNNDEYVIERLLNDTSALNPRRETLIAKEDLKNFCLDCMAIMIDFKDAFLEFHRDAIANHIAKLMSLISSDEVLKRDDYEKLLENLQKLCNPIFKISDNGEPVFMNK